MKVEGGPGKVKGGAAGTQISRWPIGQGAPTTNLFVLRYVNFVSFGAASYNDVNIYTHTHTMSSCRSVSPAQNWFDGLV